MTKRNTRRPPHGPYEVGYGRPPQSSRFKKGRSGNPGGRPKKQAFGNVGEVVRALLSRQVTFVDSGKRQRASVLELAGMIMAKKAMAGDLKAISGIFQLAERHGIPVDLDVTGTPIDHGAIVRQKLNDMAHRMALRDAAEAAEAAAATHKEPDEEPDEGGSSA